MIQLNFKIAFVFTMAIAVLTGCSTPEKLPLVDNLKFEKTINNQEVKLYNLKNSNGLVAQITNLGGRVVSLFVPDKQGNFADVSLGFKTAQEYMDASVGFYGAVIGRYGNRIAKGMFVIEEDTFKLAINNNPNALHGGPTGFYKRVWDASQISDNKLELHYVSKDMEEGYPGKLDVKVVYELTDKNELKIEYFASTDKATYVNLTNHTYFNLAGEGNGSINNQLLYLNANSFTPVDSTLIPTGKLTSVEGTPMDFRTPQVIGSRVNDAYQQLKFGNGYDHNWVLNSTKEGLVHAATVTEPVSGRVMEVYTNEPGIQFYGGNFMAGIDMGKYGKTFKFREALCLETQHFPDSPNQPNFPSTLLNPGEQYHSVCIYQFKTK